MAACLDQIRQLLVISGAFPCAAQFRCHRLGKTNVDTAERIYLFAVDHDDAVDMPIEDQWDDHGGQVLLVIPQQVILVLTNIVDDLCLSLPAGASNGACGGILSVAGRYQVGLWSRSREEHELLRIRLVGIYAGKRTIESPFQGMHRQLRCDRLVQLVFKLLAEFEKQG